LAEGRSSRRGAITTSMTIDYMGRAAIADWLHFVTGFIHAGRRTAVTQAIVTTGDRAIARANARFAFDDRESVSD
jgi:acyl-coenzyme A thioesterase PaaI-like protein